MIIGKPDIRSMFEKAWVTCYVPALLQFGGRGRKKSIKDTLSKLVETGKCVILE